MIFEIHESLYIYSKMDVALGLITRPYTFSFLNSFFRYTVKDFSACIKYTRITLSA